MTNQDSTLQNNYVNQSQKDSLTTQSNYLFSSHLLKPIHSTPIINTSQPFIWQGIVLFTIFSIYVLIKISEPKKYIKLFSYVLSMQSALLTLREEFKLAKRISLLLGISFILVFSFLLYFTNSYFGLILNQYSLIQQYLFFVFLLFLIYTVKLIFNYIFAHISSNKEIGKENSFNVIVFSQTLGIVILPLIICLQFTKYPSNYFLYPALIISLAFYILRLFRNFILLITEQNIGILYIFLYLCGLEILPILILAKFLLVNF